MNRRSFISKIVQGGTVVATGLPEKLLSSEANTVDKLPFEILMYRPKFIKIQYPAPNPDLNHI